MSRIDEIFQNHRTNSTKALMPFLTGGFPSLEDTAQALEGMEAAGASIVEIGFPFSDPIADGPVIAASMHETLEGGLRLDDLFNAIEAVRPRTQLGLVAMVSDSIIARRGEAAFVERAAAAGFDGLIVPDIDLARASSLGELADRHDLSLTFLLAPTTRPDRAQTILSICRGFVYLLAQTGLTGERSKAPDVEGQVSLIRACSELPIAVGFGISTPAHVEAVTRHADAAIVGSALVRRMAAAREAGRSPAQAAIEFTAELAVGLSSAPARS